MPSSAKFYSGVSAALFAPFLMVLGFMIWDDHWTKKKGSAFSLNMFKCNITAVWFLIAIIFINTQGENGQSGIEHSAGLWMQLNPIRNENIKFLFASSAVGILIGDFAWIEGLKHVGARKVIVMDSLKPFLATLAGWFFFDEKFNNPLAASIGLVFTVVGVALVGLEVEDGKKQEHGNVDANRNHDHFHSTESARNAQEKKIAQSYCYGMFMAVSNVFLHTIGATLTKKFGAEMTTWDMNFVRFGFSGMCMLMLTSLMRIRDQSSRLSLNPSLASSASTSHYGSVPTTFVLPPESPSLSQSSNYQEPQWYALPNLSLASWIRVTVGVVFVSFMQPALTNYAMFQIPLALLLTLESIGPLYSLPLALIVHKECPSFQASVGAVLAVVGIVLLSF